MSSLNAFMKRFVESARRDWRVDGSAFTLILGAGASRSSGIPTARLMEDMLRRLAAMDGLSVPDKPAREQELSWLYRKVTQRLRWTDEFSDYPREFIMGCICRAEREANLTHLIAAHLSEAHVIGDIVTTNFDDLTLAAFWSLPWSSAYVEPHVIYDPRAAGPLRVAPGVPVIIKAHGHHTIYGLDIIDRDVKATAPHVKQIMAARPQPEIGYLVVGYSGGWSDGVMATLSDAKLMKGKTVYWFHIGDEPKSKYIDLVKRRSDVQFIKIVDADLLFLRMWHELHMEEEWTNPPLFEDYNLFNLSRNGPRSRSPRERDGKWWDVWMLPSTTQGLRNHPRLVELRRELLPLLDAIDQRDDELMFFDCAPAAFRRRIQKAGNAYSWFDLKELQALHERVPTSIEWTRRNRKLLRLALTKQVDPVMPYILLSALSQY